MKQQHTICSLQELDRFSKTLMASVTKNIASNQATIITLKGDLGAGKTTLGQYIGKHLGVTEPMGSPTFVITKYYDLQNQAWKRLIHIDAYRLDGQNLDPLDFPTLFNDANNIIVIEWPEFLTSVLPEQSTDLTISHNLDDSRAIDIR